MYKHSPEVYRPSLVTTQASLADVLQRMNNYDSALECINGAIALNKDVPILYEVKGEIHLMQGKNEEALQMWKKVLELNPNYLEDYPEGTELSNGLKKLGLIE